MKRYTINNLLVTLSAVKVSIKFCVQPTVFDGKVIFRFPALETESEINKKMNNNELNKQTNKQINK